jgi:hypothetical protein
MHVWKWDRIVTVAKRIIEHEPGILLTTLKRRMPYEMDELLPALLDAAERQQVRMLPVEQDFVLYPMGRKEDAMPGSVE